MPVFGVGYRQVDCVERLALAIAELCILKVAPQQVSELVDHVRLVMQLCKKLLCLFALCRGEQVFLQLLLGVDLLQRLAEWLKHHDCER